MFQIIILEKIDKSIGYRNQITQIVLKIIK